MVELRQGIPKTFAQKQTKNKEAVHQHSVRLTVLIIEMPGCSNATAVKLVDLINLV